MHHEGNSHQETQHQKRLSPTVNARLRAGAARHLPYGLCRAGLLLQAGIRISPRRAGTLLRNVLAVHAGRVSQNAAADTAESAWLALSHSLPHAAAGEKINAVKVLAAHREAWKLARMEKTDPRRIVLLEKDPLIRSLRATPVDSLKPSEFSTIVADSLATLPPTAAVECRAEPRMLINPAFVDQWADTPEKLLMLVMHELHHILLGHTRFFPRATVLTGTDNSK